MHPLLSEKFSTSNNPAASTLASPLSFLHSLSSATTLTPLRPDFGAWAARSYKPLTVLALSVAALVLCHAKAGQEVLLLAQTAAITGAGGILLGILASPVWSKLSVSAAGGSRFRMPSPVQAFSHPGSLLLGLTSLMVAYANHHSQFAWTIYPTLALLAGFALGGAALLLVVIGLEDVFTGYFDVSEANDHAAHPHPFMAERLDILTGTVVAGMLLGTTLVEANAFNLADSGLASGVVWLPALLAWCGVCASMAMKHVLRHLDVSPTVARMLNVMAMLIVSYLLVVTLMPAYWVIEGEENLSSEIFLAAGIGTVGGFILLEAGYVYQWLRSRYYAWVFAKPQPAEKWYLKPLRHVFRVVCLTVPVLLVAWFMRQVFDHVGLYGIVIAAITLLGNLNVRLMFPKTVGTRTVSTLKSGYENLKAALPASLTLRYEPGAAAASVQPAAPHAAGRTRHNRRFSPPPAYATSKPQAGFSFPRLSQLFGGAGGRRVGSGRIRFREKARFRPRFPK